MKNSLEIITFQELGDASLLVCGYLRPQELASLGASCRHLRDAIRARLAKICASQLPMTLGVGSNYLVEFARGHSFEGKAALVDHCIGLTKNVNLLHMGATSFDRSKSGGATDFEQSEAMARKSFEEHTSAVFVSARSEKRSERVTCTVECNYTPRLSDRDSALSWVKYIVDRDACKGTTEDREAYKLIKTWIEWLTLTQRESDVADAGLWRWTCKHRDLYGKGIAGVGVTLSKTNAAEGIEDRLELRLTRMF